MLSRKAAATSSENLSVAYYFQRLLTEALLRNSTPAIVDLLLTHGANPSKVGTALNSTAFHLAAKRCRPDFIALLLKRGADPEELDTNGRTALEALLSDPEFQQCEQLDLIVSMLKGS
jgi:ankyrin repeat protein